MNHEKVYDYSFWAEEDTSTWTKSDHLLFCFVKHTHTHTEEKAEGLFTQYCMIVYVFVYSQVSIVKSEETKVRQEDLSKLLYEVQVLRSQQENMEMQMQDMKQ